MLKCNQSGSCFDERLGQARGCARHSSQRRAAACSCGLPSTREAPDRRAPTSMAQYSVPPRGAGPLASEAHPLYAVTAGRVPLEEAVHVSPAAFRKAAALAEQAGSVHDDGLESPGDADDREGAGVCAGPVLASAAGCCTATASAPRRHFRAPQTPSTCSPGQISRARQVRHPCRSWQPHPWCAVPWMAARRRLRPCCSWQRGTSPSPHCKSWTSRPWRTSTRSWAWRRMN